MRLQICLDWLQHTQAQCSCWFTRTSGVCAVDLDYGFVSNVTHSLNPLVRNTHKLWFDGGGALCDNLIPQRDPVKPAWGPRSWGQGAAEPMQGVGCSCGNFHCRSILLRAESELGSLPRTPSQPGVTRANTVWPTLFLLLNKAANQTYCGQWAKCNSTVMNEIATEDTLTLKYRRDWGDLWVEKLLNWWLDSEPIQRSICAGLKWNVDFFGMEWIDWKATCFMGKWKCFKPLQQYNLKPYQNAFK